MTVSFPSNWLWFACNSTADKNDFERLVWRSSTCFDLSRKTNPTMQDCYQEKCIKCKTLFWGQRDAPLCKPCEAKQLTAP
jgi:hypothetical protein